MLDLWFYIKLGLSHVLDISAYDHVLFLATLVSPFTFKSWKKVFVLASIFTVAHCLSLLFSVYDFWVVDLKLIEFLIPVTIIVSCLFNFSFFNAKLLKSSFLTSVCTTVLFGLIHGFGFSNYFKMLVMGENSKLFPLVGFASGIEIAQLIIVMVILGIAYIFQNRVGVSQKTFLQIFSSIILVITIPLLINTIPF